MLSFAHRANKAEQRAREAREQAEQATDSHARKLMIAIADNYDRIVRRAAARAAIPKSGD
jgi:pyruvate-formate lyase